MTIVNIAGAVVIVACALMALAMTGVSWLRRQQPRCIRCHTHHLPGHDCDGTPLDLLARKDQP